MKPYSLQSCLYLGLLFLSLVTCGFAGDKTAGTHDQGQHHEESKMSQISEAVLALDLSAAKEMAKAQGAAAVPELMQLLQHDDNGVRADAVIALGEIDHPDAFKALMNAAKEGDNTVAGTAVAQLTKHGSRIGAGQFTQLLRTMKSDAARAQLVLTIGQRGSDGDRDELQSFCGKNGDPETALSCRAALAKLGSETARKDFAEYLTSMKDMKAFALAEYIDQRWLLPYLGHLLRSTDPVQYLGDMPPKFPRILRVCDKAVVLIAKISGERFSYPTNVHMNYDIDQLTEAAKVAGPLP
ncbi:MAG: HEAT repeat domain-containing protein [Pseudomonadota bacterium]